MKLLEHHPVADDVLDVVAHHRRGREEKVKPEIGVRERGKSAVPGFGRRRGSADGVQGTRGSRWGVRPRIVADRAVRRRERCASLPAARAFVVESGGMRIALLIWALTAPLAAGADEGMWTFDNFPTASVQKAYGAQVTTPWLDHVRLSTARLTNCTASFVSAEGLMLTNHHCVESCLAEQSSANNSLIDRGFLAAKRSEERRCATQLADVLVGTEDVTEAVTKAQARPR